MKRLIVNGDDFAFTRGVNAGVLRCFQEGILTSTTLMANGAAFDDAVERARANPRLGVGCHLVLVGGHSVAPPKTVPSLVDSEGRLPKSLPAFWLRLSSGSVKLAELERELRAQIERVCSAGIQPTHLDTHKHTHLHPRVMEALARVASEFGIRAVRKPFERVRNLLGRPTGKGKRPAYLKQSAVAAASRASEPAFRRHIQTHGLETPDHFYGVGLTGLLDRQTLLALLGSLPEGTSELMCHPGVYDEELERAPTRLKQERQQEMEALTDPDVRRAIQEHAVVLISYREFACAHV